MVFFLTDVEPDHCIDVRLTIPLPATGLMLVLALVAFASGRAAPQKEKGIAVVSRAEKQEQQIRVAVFFGLIPVVVAFSFIIFLLYRSKRELLFKQKESEFKLNIAELEMKALRAQINPHFIFNCLNSIHHYMQQNNVRQAGEYLIKFSRLIRYVLETSSSRMVTIADDLDVLRIYMELEQLRLQGSFDFEIATESIADHDAIQIPPMILQPFVENSIWHGLSHRTRGGKIRIYLLRKNEMIQCVIEDNGERKEKSSSADSLVKKNSLGMSLIKARLDVISKMYNMDASFTVEDRRYDPTHGEGTRVVIRLPFIE
jgi:LytS/YehU family sensor histidine kinase